jgi:leader peptidase (prepilin peptidase)/N-methyltransferase
MSSFFIPSLHDILLLIGVALIAAQLINLIIDRLPKLLVIEWKSESCEILAIKNTNATTLKHQWSFLQHCQHCDRSLGLFYSLPVIGRLFRKRCKHCKTPIATQPLIVDVLTLLSSFLIFTHFGTTPTMLFALCFTYLLITLIFIDLEHQLLPDQLTLLLLWVGLICSINSTFIPPTTAIIGALAGYLFFYLIALGFKVVTKRDGLGYGDFKMLAAMGAWVGWPLLPILVLIASLLACFAGLSLMCTRKESASKAYPFGPYLAIGGWITLLYGNTINTYYMHLLGLVQ